MNKETTDLGYYDPDDMMGKEQKKQQRQDGLLFDDEVEEKNPDDMKAGEKNPEAVSKKTKAEEKNPDDFE